VYPQNIKKYFIILLSLSLEFYLLSCIDLNTDLRKDNEFNDTSLSRDTNDAKKVACIQNHPFAKHSSLTLLNSRRFKFRADGKAVQRVSRCEAEIRFLFRRVMQSRVPK